MEFLKKVEIGFRRLLVRSLGLLVHRGRVLPASMDFSERKFLFVRQDRIGDVLVSTPLIHALKNRYPKAIVDFLLSSNNHFVLANESMVRKRWIYRKTLASAFEIVRSVRREKYDFVIDLMDNPSATSTVLCALAGGEWNVGLSKGNEYIYDVAVPLLSRKETHIVDRLAMLLTVFDIQPEGLDLRITFRPSPEAVKFAARFVEEHRLEGKKIIGINISPGEGARFWGVNNYQALIRWLRADHGDYPLLVLYQPSDRRVAEDVVRPFADVLLSPETRDFDQFAALVERSTLLVTPDTSAVHLAAAFSIPSVVLYVQSNKDLRVWEPYGSRSEIIVTDVDDLQTIPLERVVAALNRLFDEIRTARRRRRKAVASSL